MDLIQKILFWFNKFKRDNLPWKNNKIPYDIWISEIMLQQTQVQVVIPYFYRFINLFPSVNILEQASLDKILYVWTGLGYYARARNLYKSAKIIVQQYGGIFPDTFEKIILLPGIGRSTAGAILSFAFNKRYPILDVNVKRILIRYYGLFIKKKNDDLLWNIMQELILQVPEVNIGDFNQSLMDLGSMICTPFNPKCTFCPIQKKCEFYLQYYCNNDIQNAMCVNKKISVILKKKSLFFLILKYTNEIWLEKILDKSLWQGLFCFPRFFSMSELKEWLMLFDFKLCTYRKIKKFKYIVSKFNLEIESIVLDMKDVKLFKNRYFINYSESLKDNGLWFNLENPPVVGLAGPLKYLFTKL